jgi:hypothetical protein
VFTSLYRVQAGIICCRDLPHVQKGQRQPYGVREGSSYVCRGRIKNYFPRSDMTPATQGFEEADSATFSMQLSRLVHNDFHVTLFLDYFDADCPSMAF